MNDLLKDFKNGKMWMLNNPEELTAYIKILINIKYGISYNTINDWVKIFGNRWSYQRVRNFFNKLTIEGIITYERHDNTTKLTVCNYKGYKDEIIKPEKLLSIYEKYIGVLPPVKKFTDRKREKCRTRILHNKNNIEEYLEDFKQSIIMANNIPFCKGSGNNNWFVTFGWLINNDENYLKILEGKYGKPKRNITESIRQDAEFIYNQLK